MLRIPSGAKRRYMNEVRALPNRVESCAQRI